MISFLPLNQLITIISFAASVIIHCILTIIIYYHFDNKNNLSMKNYDSIENLEKNSLDFYASVKSLYLQDRQQKILNTTKIIDTQDDSDWEEIESQ